MLVLNRRQQLSIWQSLAANNTQFAIAPMHDKCFVHIYLGKERKSLTFDSSEGCARVEYDYLDDRK